MDVRESHQINEGNQAIVEGGKDVAILNEATQAFLVYGLGRHKVELLTLTLVASRTPGRRTDCDKERPWVPTKMLHCKSKAMRGRVGVLHDAPLPSLTPLDTWTLNFCLAQIKSV